MVAVVGESVSGAERGGDKQWMQMMAPMKRKRMRVKASGWESYHEFERSTRRTRVQEEQVR